MVVLLGRRGGRYLPTIAFRNMPAAEAALQRLAACAARRGARAEVVGSLLIIDGKEAFALTITPCWPRGEGGRAGAAVPAAVAAMPCP
ncbi:MAG: hypothetical protein RMK67_02645 [Chloroflexota bacterium]|nr:hypothetical protein [Chloroflexota bacterium]